MKKEVKHIVHLEFVTDADFEILNEIKKLTGVKTSKGAVLDALKQFPKFVNKGDFLNAELITVNRRLELLELQQQVYKYQNKE